MKLFSSLALAILILAGSTAVIAQENSSPAAAIPPARPDPKILNEISKRLTDVPTNANGLQDPGAIVVALRNVEGITNIQAHENGSVTMQFSDSGLPLTIANDMPVIAPSH